MEYEIARRGRRIDAVLLTDKTVNVIEFKTGGALFDSSGAWQVYEYALDLRDFHAASTAVPIVPVLVSIASAPETQRAFGAAINIGRQVHEVIRCNAAELPHAIRAINDSSAQLPDGCIDAIQWRDAPYKPSINIIETAERIFSGHEVREISHSTASNLTATVDAVVDVVRAAQNRRRRVACFVTGVPGASKTLAGLSAVHDPVLRENNRPAAVFLSGNGPLVRIVRAALARDVKKRRRDARDSGRQVSTFIQNVHNFLGHYAFQSVGDIPPEHVVIFDEAQRAWDGKQMHAKKRGAKSEAEIMLEIMERCSD